MRTKKLLSLVLTALMLLALTLPALADGGYTITINNTATGHTYEAYQIFTGELSEKDGKKVLSNVEWGSGVKGDDLLAALKEDSSLEEDFEDCTSAADVAAVLAKDIYGNDAAKTQTFAKLAGANLTTTVAGTSGAQADGKYVISNLAPGYYLVKDKDSSNLSNNDAYTRYILEVVGDATVNVKVSVPTIDKEIQERTEKVNVNEASIGDKVEYVVTSKVPDMTGYNKYYFVVNDTMSKGLTFNNDVTITVGGKTLTKDTDYTVSSSTDETTGVTTIKIVFKNFIQYTKDAEIVIKYSATLNANAEIGTANVNEVNLVYSNNPNYKYEGEGDEPKTDESTGKTPKKTTETYTTELTITKTDDEQNILTGAAFRLTGNGVNIVIVTGEVFVEDEAGTYYKLVDGTYTTTAPTTEGIDASKYEDTSKKYKKETKVTIVPQKGVTVNVEGFVDSTGQLTFTGLGTGTYKLEEIVTPVGYNTIAPIEFTISFNATAKKFSTDNKNITVGDNTNKLAITIENKSGSTLPSTGGMGTTLFYVVGALLAVGAGVLLATRKKMSAEK